MQIQPDQFLCFTFVFNLLEVNTVELLLKKEKFKRDSLHKWKLRKYGEYINDEQLFALMRDMMFTGADKMNNTLEHAIILLSRNPQVQQRVQAKIDVLYVTDVLVGMQ